LGLNGGHLTAMRQAIAAKPDAIIEQPLKEAKAAGIPVIVRRTTAAAPSAAMAGRHSSSAR
jgi:ABC-type sugar transport system substrate-binding protein